MRKALTTLTTRRLDGRSAVAVAVKRWKEDVRGDLGGGLSRAQETLLELAAQSWVIVSSLDDWIGRQPSLVTRKRQLLPVVVQRQTLVDSLSRLLDKLGTKRRAKPVSLPDYLREHDARAAS